jgi:cell division protease FtsH
MANKGKPNSANRKPRKIPPPAAGGTGFWKILIWFFLLWIAFTYIFRSFGGEDRVNLSYTEFKKQVQDANIKRVTFKGDEIKGAFEKKYLVVSDSGKDSTYYESFASVKPAIQDPELMKILEANNVNINAKTEGRSWLLYALIMVLPWVLIIGYFIYMRRRMQGQMKGMGGGIFGIGKSRAKRYRKTDVSVSYDDVAGLENAKMDMEEIVEYLRSPAKFTKLGADIPKGVLLIGPPGTGKTLLARATAGEADVPFFSISGSEFIEMFVGVGASRVRDLFDTAKREAPSIIFIDELDSIGRARGTGLGGGHDEREQTLNQILSEMDGFAPHESVIILAATNRPDILDAALTRPGRFDRQITMEMPQKNARQKILEIHTRHVPLNSQVDLENIAARTVGFSGADLKNLVNEAALLAGRKSKNKVFTEDFEEARDKIILGHEREDIMHDEEKKVIAYHEAGHALMAKLMPGADPLQKVTIIPRGRALGATEQAPEEDRHNFPEDYLLNRIGIAMGGRAAEKAVFGTITNGAASDLKYVTKLARKMVTQWGMSDKVGPVTFSLGEEHMFLGREMAQPKEFSENTATLIDQEIRRIVTEMEEKAIKTMKENRKKLDELAEMLLEHETLDRSEVDAIFRKKAKEKEKAEAVS